MQTPILDDDHIERPEPRINQTTYAFYLFLLGLGLAFRLQHWPYGTLLTVCGMGFTAGYGLWLILRSSSQGVTPWAAFVVGSAGIGYVLYSAFRPYGFPRAAAFFAVLAFVFVIVRHEVSWQVKRRNIDNRGAQ